MEEALHDVPLFRDFAALRGAAALLRQRQHVLRIDGLFTRGHQGFGRLLNQDGVGQAQLLAAHVATEDVAKSAAPQRRGVLVVQQALRMRA